MLYQLAVFGGAVHRIGEGEYHSGRGSNGPPSTSLLGAQWATEATLLVHELSDTECLGLLHQAPFARLGCAYLAQPYVVPIQLAVDAEARRLYGFFFVGQKISWMRRNPKVCVLVDQVVDKDRWATVVVSGRYEELVGAAHTESRHRAEALLQVRRDWWLPGAAETPAGARGEAVIFQIVIETMTGRRAARTAPGH